jgi:hypothetical protein
MLAFWDDLDADFRVFYRIDGIGDGDYGDLSGPRFIALADRCLSYDGSLLKAMRRLAEVHAAEEKEQQDIVADELKLANMSDLFD